MKTYLTHARVVLSDEVLEDAALLMEDGVIRAINPEDAGGAQEINLNGQHLMPGLIDLHCDALEKEVEPRPNVFFPLPFAVSQADKRNAANGITTVFHALSFANEELGVRNNDVAADVVRAIHDYRTHSLVDNRVHCRYEITDASGLPVLQSLLQNGQIHLLSVMDHTPGQGQFKDLAAYRNYLSRTYAKSADEAEALIQRKFDEAQGAYERLETLIRDAVSRGVAVASHDDDTSERVETMKSLGVNISEFPINIATAEFAKQQGMYTIMGAPNILRGKSQSGSMRAVDAIRHGVADCLCADYSPPSLLAAIFRLEEEGELTLPQAVRLVSANPAKAMNMTDRGEIAIGKRADLIAVDCIGGAMHPTWVWRGGKAVYQAAYGTHAFWQDEAAVAAHA